MACGVEEITRVGGVQKGKEATRMGGQEEKEQMDGAMGDGLKS